MKTTADNVTLPQLGSAGKCEPVHFNRLFKQITAATPYNYLLQVRLNRLPCNSATQGYR